MTLNELREVLSYDPTNGLFRWRVTRGKGIAGNIAGSTGMHGYIYIGVAGRDYLAHRLAILFSTGYMPSGHVDHINNNPSDNRIGNLRCVSNSVNMQNRVRAQRNSKSGLLGASWHKKLKRWTARIKVDGKNLYLGLFDSAEAAHHAYVEAKRRLHPGNTL